MRRARGIGVADRPLRNARSSDRDTRGGLRVSAKRMIRERSAPAIDASEAETSPSSLNRAKTSRRLHQLRALARAAACKSGAGTAPRSAPARCARHTPPPSAGSRDKDRKTFRLARRRRYRSGPDLVRTANVDQLSLPVFEPRAVGDLQARLAQVVDVDAELRRGVGPPVVPFRARQGTHAGFRLRRAIWARLLKPARISAITAIDLELDPGNRGFQAGAKPVRAVARARTCPDPRRPAIARCARPSPRRRACRSTWPPPLGRRHRRRSR